MLWWRRIPSFGKRCSATRQADAQVDMIIDEIDRPVTHEYGRRVELGYSSMKMEITDKTYSVRKCAG